jgi:hypothetical protein
VFIPAQQASGQCRHHLGAKGAVEFQLIVGGETSDKYPKADVHSSNHARIESPAWRLVKALDTWSPTTATRRRSTAGSRM